MSSAQGGRVETGRLFIAISLPEYVKDEIERAQKELRRALSGNGIGWTRREQFHVTLKFLGNVELRHVDELTNALRQACRGFSALSLRAGRIGVFPDLRRPRQIWAGVDDARRRLPELQVAVESAAAACTSEGPEGRFTGHVTLGRCKTITRTQTARLGALAQVMEKRQFGEWTVDTVDLVLSELRPRGSRYTTMAAIPLL